MFLLTVHAEFCAAHALLIQGVREPVHGHNWRVTAAVTGTVLDTDGLLCDFHVVEAALLQAVMPFDNNNLNQVPPFTQTNPSAENIAQHLTSALSARLDPTISPNAGVAWVRVTEAPGCAITYYTPWGQRTPDAAR